MHTIQPLFDDDEGEVQLEFTFTDSPDCNNCEISFTGCPDCIISLYLHRKDYSVNLGYGEVKRGSMANDHYMVNLYLIRLATLGKNTMNVSKLTGNLSIHVVGKVFVKKKKKQLHIK